MKNIAEETNEKMKKKVKEKQEPSYAQ